MAMKMLFFTLVQIVSWLALGTCDYVNDNILRIIGGDEIRIQDAPYMARLRPPNVLHHCGASIVSEQFLISAAHCYRKGELIITVGTDSLLEGGEDYAVQEMVLHLKYRDTIFNNDIAVVKLKKKLTFNERVQPIKLAEPGLVIEDSAEFLIVGFGKTESASSSNKLLSVKVSHVPKKECSTALGSILTGQMICAGQKTKGGCSGDSGGPLVYGDTLIGAVSFGREQCDGFTVFARISALRDFVDQAMSEN